VFLRSASATCHYSSYYHQTRRGGSQLKAVLVFIDGTICDRQADYGLIGTPEFYQRDSLLRALPVPGSVDCLLELGDHYEIVYMGARPPHAMTATREWLTTSGYPSGDVYLALRQDDRLSIARQIRSRYEFAAGIGDRWDDNELHLEIGCTSIIVKEHEADWDVVRRHLLR
jgi:hypothetical protein